MSLLDDTYALIVVPSHAIGTIIPHTVVEEIHSDNLIITDHPVERGAIISDHAFKLPCEVEMRVGWSDSTAGEEGFVDEVYAEMLDLQMLREPFDVYTTRRVYQNMLVRSIAVTNDQRTEHALMASIGLREVLITDTSTTTTPAQDMPQKTGAETNTGVKQVQEVFGGSVPAGTAPL